jgi:hypothetical protein
MKSNKGWLALGCLIAGIPLAAYGLSGGGALFAIVGLAFVLAFWFFAWQWISGAGKPTTPIKPSADAAWNMRDQAPLSPTPSPSPASGAGDRDGSAPRRGPE